MAKKTKRKTTKQKSTQKTTKKKSTISLGRKILISFLAILCIICVAINSWYLYIYLHGKGKIVSNTFEVGLQTIEDGTTKYFAEILLNKNENGDGLQTFEIKYNYLVDEDKSAFYSQGQQFTSSGNNLFGISNTRQDSVHVSGAWYWEEKQNNYYSQVLPTANTNYFNYSSADDYDTATISSNPLNQDSSFKIELGDDIFLMKFNYENKLLQKSGKFYDFNVVYGYHYTNAYYILTDEMYFAKTLYDSVKILKSGTSQAILFEFGELFNYYKFNESTGKYDKVTKEDTTLIIHDIKSYYALKVTINAGGAKKAVDDSLFNCINGNANYNSTGDYTTSDYFIGRTVIHLNINHFEYVDTDTLNAFKLKLKENTKNYYLQYKDTIVLHIRINLDQFNDEGITFAGFSDNCFKDFNVYIIETVETIDNQEIIKGVEL